MKARDIMTRQVRTADLTTPVQKIAKTMVSRRISGVPVVDRKGHVLGIVTEGDLLRHADAGTERRPTWWSALFKDPDTSAREYVKSRGGQARDVMTRHIISVTEATDASDIAAIMERWDIKRVPVVRAGKLVGIVSRRDLVKAIAKRPAAAKGKRPADAEIRETLRRKLGTAGWLGSSLLNFSVHKQIVELTGLVNSAAQHNAVRVMAERIPGVRSIKDRLTVVPRMPYGG